MKSQKSEPFLYFNFKNSEDQIVPLQFSQPLNIITTATPEHVIPCLVAIEQAINEGYYAAGYLSYEAAVAFNDEYTVHQHSQMPLLWFGIFSDPLENELDLNDYFHTTPWHPTVSTTEYNQAIDKIHEHIKQNKTEQVNYTIKLKSTFDGDPFSFYKQIEEAQSAHYSAFINDGKHTIMSASPELFFQLKDGLITTKPMKGTIERGQTYEQDIQHAFSLKKSLKNRKENELITHLMIDELKNMTIPQSVRITKAFEVEKYPTLYQMTSTIQGKILPDIGLVDIFKHLFPAGSITGLPKTTTMQIINELETEPRNIYCGAIGYITPDEAIFNVPIRTVLLHNQTREMEYGVGGGITIGSNKHEEYNEVLTKAKLLTEKRKTFELLETIGIKNGEYIVLDLHLKRLQQSAGYFNFTIRLDDINKALQNLVKSHPYNEWKVRLLLSQKGDFSLETEQIFPSTQTRIITLAKQPVEKRNPFLYHKTTNRAIYETHRTNDPNVFDVLLWNEDFEITEFTTGNVVIKMKDDLVTPPVECGLLPGTFREKLLKDGNIIERKIKRDELKDAEKIWYINSVREWIPVTF